MVCSTGAGCGADVLNARAASGGLDHLKRVGRDRILLDTTLMGRVAVREAPTLRIGYSVQTSGQLEP